MTRPVRRHADELLTTQDRARRFAALDAVAMTALVATRCAIAARFGAVPYPDPLDGGTAARLLLLLETPGPDGAPVQGPTLPRFVSRDNPTGTARNVRRFAADAGLERADMLIWNAVPWVIHTPGARNRAPRAGEVAAGLALLPAILALLPALRVVVLAGRVAAQAAPVVGEAVPAVTILTIPHPSPVYVNTVPAIAPGIVAVFREAARILAHPA